jgi:hypothetical protein
MAFEKRKRERAAALCLPTSVFLERPKTTSVDVVKAEGGGGGVFGILASVSGS